MLQRLYLRLIDACPGSAVEGTIWTVTEVAVGCISVCLPTLRPLFVRSHTYTSSDNNTKHSCNVNGSYLDPAKRGVSIKLDGRAANHHRSRTRDKNGAGREKAAKQRGSGLPIWRTSTFSTRIVGGLYADARLLVLSEVEEQSIGSFRDAPT